jgi:tetratricopeptide (TPR) repeat protein
VPIGVIAAIAGAILAIALLGGGDDQQRASSSSAAQAGQRTRSTAAGGSGSAAKPPPTQTSPATAPPAASQDPAALNDQGYALSKQGNYAAAIPLLRASVDGYRSAGRTKEIGYAFALFNLAVALNRTGDHAGAIELLTERLQFANQRGTVQEELRDAQAQLSGATGAAGGRKPKKNKGSEE